VDSGRAALRACATTPVGFPRIQNEPIVRVPAHIVGDAQVLEGLRALHADLDDIEAALDAADAVAGDLLHRERYCASTTVSPGGSSRAPRMAGRG
jgi:hypothetical protein